jgi:TRAP-type C4-dicarboxylate transport system permease small subunit
MGWLCRLDRLIATIIAAAQWLALPLILLLFLQWPLRDIVHAYSSQANDLGQIVFALYVAVSISAATRAGTHLAADAMAQHLCVPKTLSALISRRNRLTSDDNVRPALFRPGRLGLAIQVEKPA